MNNIIQHFEEKITCELEKELKNLFIEENRDISDVITLVNKNLNELGRNIIKYLLEKSNEVIKDSPERLKSWVVKQNDMDKTLITKFGSVEFQRTYFGSKEDKGYTYLVDDVFGIKRYQRIDDGLASKMVELSRDHSYQKSADLAVEEVDLSRQTVKNKIRELGEIDNRELDNPEEKKEIKRLYVEADEDHISLQDGTNTIAKLVYVHEGTKKKGSRAKLKNVYYFSGQYKNVEDLWLEVIDYIDANYEVDKIETTYLSGDGASWIQEGLNWLPRPKYVLDRYHLNKYVLMATGHMPEKRFKLWEAINKADISAADIILKEIIKQTEKETKKQAVKDARKYILSNWGGIKIYKEDPYVIGCSAEGHVSHVLSSRMSSRPLGWSEIGAEHMARLRAFKYNGGNQKDIKKLIKNKRKVSKLEIKTEKIIERKSKKSLYAEAKETVPAIGKGKVTGLFRALKSISF